MKSLLKMLKKKKQERIERNEMIVRDFIQNVVNLVKMQDENIIQFSPQVPVESIKMPESNCTRKKPLHRWLAAVVVCVLCLAVILPFALCNNNKKDGGLGDGNGGSGEKPYNIEYAKVLGMDDGIFFDDIYATVLANEDMLIFKQIIPGSDASVDIYNDETKELLSYKLSSFVAYEGIGADNVVFKVDYRVRIVPQYLFDGCQMFYGNLVNSFYVGMTEIKWKYGDIVASIGTRDRTAKDYERAYVSFAFGAYDYFLEIRTFEYGSFGVVTELKEENLIKLFQGLIQN